MVRWEGGTEGRLARAAYELYLERGFDDVTIAEIAERAGLTKRTFFRYFADKREVLFLGAAAFQESVVRAVLDAPGDVTAVDAVVAALSARPNRSTPSTISTTLPSPEIEAPPTPGIAAS